MFAQFVSMREKQTLIWATGIQEEYWGVVGPIFLEIVKQQLF